MNAIQTKIKDIEQKMLKSETAEKARQNKWSAKIEALRTQQTPTKMTTGMGTSHYIECHCGETIWLDGTDTRAGYCLCKCGQKITILGKAGSDAMKKKWANPEFKAMMIERMKSPEAKAKFAATRARHAAEAQAKEAENLAAADTVYVVVNAEHAEAITHNEDEKAEAGVQGDVGIVDTPSTKAEAKRIRRNAKARERRAAQKS